MGIIPPLRLCLVDRSDEFFDCFSIVLQFENLIEFSVCKKNAFFIVHTLDNMSEQSILHVRIFNVVLFCCLEHAVAQALTSFPCSFVYG